MAASIVNYISVLQSPVADGSGFDLVLKSSNRSPAVTITATVSGLMRADSPSDVVTKIKDALDAQLVLDSALYSGAPSFQNGVDAPFTFKSYQTEHTLCVWSQASYLMSLANNTSGCSTIAEDIPIFMTLNELEKLAPRFSLDLTGLLDADKIQLLTIISQQVISFVGYVPTATIYLHEARGYGTNGTSLDYTPIIQCDYPVFRTSNPIESLVASNAPLKTQYDLDYSTGVMTFTDYGVMSRFVRPMDFNNFLRVSYVAGSAHIPPGIKQEAVKLGTVVGSRPNVARLKVGTFQVDYRQNKDYINEIKMNILGSL